jgi:hypothetical protein
MAPQQILAPGSPLARHVWRYGEALPDAERGGMPTGFPALDRILPQRGWCADGLNELLGNEQGVGEFSLLLPALAHVCRQGQAVVLANPPFLPYAPALEQAGIVFAHLIVVRHADGHEMYWAAEQAMRSKACGAVVVWSDEAARALPDLLLRRLHMAAHAGSCAGFLFRPRRAREQASPAPLRLVFAPSSTGELELTVHKARGTAGHPGVRVQAWRHAWAKRPSPLRMPARMPAGHGMANVARSTSGGPPSAIANSTMPLMASTRHERDTAQPISPPTAIGPRLKTPSPNNSGDPCLKAGCIEAGAGPWRGFPLRDFARSSEEQR